MRKPIISANWKMNKTISEAVSFCDEFIPLVRGVNDVEIIIAPPYTALQSVIERCRGTNILISAQNLFYEEKGAYTGEISPVMLKDIGCEYSIIGHSERRQYFGETNEIINKKLKAALKVGLRVILCIGETLEERNSGRTFDVLDSQIKGALEGIGLDNVVIAYEPVWAIGTGVTATPLQAEEAHQRIRALLREIYGSRAEEIRILYGGSVTPENIDSLMTEPDIDGALVGGASLKPESFAKIVNYRRK